MQNIARIVQIVTKVAGFTFMYSPGKKALTCAHHQFQLI